MSRLPAGLAVLALTLAACSGGSDSSVATGVASTSATSTSATPATATPSDSASGSASSSPGDQSTPTSAPSPRMSESKGTGAETGGTAEFVRVVRARVPEVAAGRTTAEIAAIATAACKALRAGRSADAVQAQARSLGTLDAEATDDATARELVKLAIDTTCLDQARRVDQF